VLNEIKILFGNINKLRKHSLNEAVSENTLIDAINEHKIIYVYYAGDETILKGYRTIRPFVIGTHKNTGNRVLRAWQDAGSSDSYNGLNRTPRMGHEKINGPKGVKPGWRLFNVEFITSLMPTGEKFTPEEYFNTGGVKYNPNDSDMSSIDAAIEITKDKLTQTQGLKSMDKPDIVANKVDKSDFDTQASKFKQFFRAAEKTRDVTKDEIERLWDIVKTYRKKSPRQYWVVQNEKGDMILKTQRGIEIDKIPETSVVGNLKDLYNKYVTPEKKSSTEFFDKTKKDLFGK
jgi:hypothetical protein